MAVRGQKEISFTLCRKKEEKKSDFPKELVNLYLTIHYLACKGLTVDVEGCTSLIEFFPGMRNIIYTKVKYQEIRMAPNVIHAILITDEERLVYENYGMLRLLGHMGNAERRFPFPQWSDRFRKSIVTMADMELSFLNQLMRVKIPGACVTMMKKSKQTDCIKLKVSSDKHAMICDVISKIEPQAVLTILTDLDYEADSCLTWKAGESLRGIAKSNGAANRLGGCFVIFCPCPPNKFQIIEDGFYLQLTDSTYQHIRQAFLSRNSLIYLCL